MKVIFLDFDGVLNSRASFIMENRRRQGLSKKKKEELGPINESLCHVCCSNFQLILEHFPEVKIVISSTWRELFDLEWLKAKLSSYGIDSSRVIDRTPGSFGRSRGFEINSWLEDHPEVKTYLILDDNHIGDKFEHEIVFTTWNVGLTLDHVEKAIKVLNPKAKFSLPWSD